MAICKSGDVSYMSESTRSLYLDLSFLGQRGLLCVTKRVLTSHMGHTGQAVHSKGFKCSFDRRNPESNAFSNSYSYTSI